MIARILLDAGAEVDAESDVYAGKCTTLGLAATSVHPYLAGVHKPLMQLLLDRGTDFSHPDMVGNGHSTFVGCLANGRGEAATCLTDRGAHLGLVDAAGVGRLDVVKTFFDERGVLGERVRVIRADSAWRDFAHSSSANATRSSASWGQSPLESTWSRLPILLQGRV